ncbi:MAG: sensor domain-containing diguanylate cyclase [bacterium]
MASDQDSSYGHLEKDFSVLRTIASELIHENAELKNSIDEKERELDLLYSMMRRITFVMDWHEIQEMVVDLIMDFFSVVRFCMIALFDERTGLMLRYRERGAEEQVADQLNVPFDINENTRWDEVVGSDEWSSYFSNLGFIKSLQTSFIPLVLKNKEIGFLMICKPKNLEYGRGEWQFLTTITNYCAVALDNSKLYQLATTDELTGLFNRRYFMNRLDRDMSRATHRNSSVAMLMADLDHFKQINDMHGHPAGDQVLIALGERLRNAADSSGIVCRFGGEEFTVLLTNIEKKEAVAKAELVREAVGSTPFTFYSDGEEISRTITISIGVAVYPDDADDAAGVINKADQALYLAKACGRNRVIAHQ